MFQFINTLRGKPVKVEEVKRFKTELAKTVKHMADYFLGNNEFLCGKRISVADIQALCELTQLYGTGDENLFLSNQKLSAWSDRVKSSLQPHYDYANENGVLRLKTLYEQSKQSQKANL